jgi:hypothetical protein
MVVGYIAIDLPILYYINIGSGAWDAYTTESSYIYKPFWAPYTIGASALSVVIAAVAVWLFVLFVRQSPHFPKVYVLWLIAFLALQIAKALATWQVTPAAERRAFVIPDYLTISCVVVGIWVLYIALSRRVKDTFGRRHA